MHGKNDHTLTIFYRFGNDLLMIEDYICHMGGGGKIEIQITDICLKVTGMMDLGFATWEGGMLDVQIHCLITWCLLLISDHHA